MRTTATSCIALGVLAFASAATAGDLLWNNNIESDGFNGRALSPPIFPDIRVADDVLVPETGWLVNEFGMAGIEDADWIPGSLMQVIFYENNAGLPGPVAVDVEGTFTRTATGNVFFDRDEYTYFITFDPAIEILEGVKHVGARFPEGGGDGSNYWTTSNGLPDGATTTGSFSIDAGSTWQDEGAGWHHTFEIYGTVPEGAPRDAHGLRHFPEGGAEISVDQNGSLVVSNIGSSGKDGVSVALGDAAEGYTGLMKMGVLPSGASVVVTHIGTKGGNSGQVLDTTSMVAGTPAIVSIKPSLEGLDAATYTLNLYNSGALVFTEPTIDPEDDKVFVDALDLTSFTATSRLTKAPNLVTGVETSAAVMVTVTGQPNPIPADRIEFVPTEVTPDLEAITNIDLNFASTGDVTINDESLRKFQLDNRVLGAAKFKAETDGLVISNIGSTGDDGVSMTLPNVISLDATVENIAFNVNRARVQLTSYNGGTQTEVGTVGMWNLNGLTGIPASYAGVGATDVLVEVFEAGVPRGSYTNPNSNLRVALVLPIDELPQLIGAGLTDLEDGPPGTYLRFDRNATFRKPDGSVSFDGDEVRVSAVLGGAGTGPYTLLDWEFDRIGSATITSLTYVAGGEPKCVPPDITGDSNNDGCVDFDDILLVLSNWDTDGTNGGDNDCSGLVDFDDLLSVLSGFGDGC